MLSNIPKANIAPSFFRGITVTVNGKKLEAKPGETVMELCDRHHIRIPRLCHHPNLPPLASCRVCLVECDGKWLSPACVTTVWDGLRIDTKTAKVREAVKSNLSELLSCHDEQCSSCVANHRCEFRDLNVMMGVTADKRSPPAPQAMDDSTNSIHLDPAKCVLCGRCIRACDHIAGQSAIIFGNRGDKMKVQPANGGSLQETSCIKCGQCTLYCPVGAITEKSQVVQMTEALANKGKKLAVVQIAPAVRIAISETFNMKPGEVTTGKCVAALRALGFDLVYDTNYGADLTIVEEANELVRRLKDPSATLPMFTSCCPAWVNYVEQSRPDLIPNLSSCRSPMGMLSGAIKEVLPKLKGVKASDIINVAIMPCTAKKDEIERPQLRTADGVKETDFVLTVRELSEMIKLANIDYGSLPDSPFDDLFGTASGAGQIFGATGGVMEAAARTAFEIYTGKKLQNVDITAVRGFEESARVAVLDLEGTKLKVAVVHGTAALVRFMKRMEEGDPELKDVLFIEVMACPGGCVVGGGTLRPKDKTAIKARLDSIYRIDASMELRKSHENPLVKELYGKYLGKVGEGKAHELFHTHFEAHPKP